MAYRRYRKKGIRPRRKSRMMSRRYSRLPRRYPSRKYSRDIAWMRKEFLLDPWLASAAGGVGKALTFQFSQIPEIATMQALYDQIIVKKIVVTFEPLFDASNSIPSSGSTPARTFLRFAHDYNDGVAPTSEQEVLNYSNCKSYSSGKPFRVVLYPRILAQSYNGGLKSVKPGFVDLNATAPVMYGIKAWYNTDPWFGAGYPFMKVRCSMVFGLRNAQ